MQSGARSILSLGAVFVCVWLGVRYLLPLVSPFLLGAGLALAAEPLVSFLHKSVGIPRPVSTGIGVSMTFFLLAIVVLLVCAFVVRELGSLAGALPDMEQTARSGIARLQSWLQSLSSQAPEGIRPLLEDNVDAVFSDGTALVNRAVGYLLGLAGNLLSHVPDSALGLGTAILSGYMISAKLPRIRQWLSRRLPRERLKPTLDAWQRMKTAVGGWIAAQCKLMGVTFALVAAGFLLLRIPYAILWAAVVALVGRIPCAGHRDGADSLEPDLPSSGGHAPGCRSAGNLRHRFGGPLRLEPKLVGRHLGLDPLITLFALYAGYKLWGIGGMLLSPLLAVTAMQLSPARPREDAP